MSIDVPTSTPAAEGESAEAAAVLCPGCGYDLRGGTTDRCSECGLEVDRTAVRWSGVPWAHRRQIGRVRAFWKTVWYVTLDKRLIRHELARPQDLRDARRFRACNAAFGAVALVGFAGVLLVRYGLESIAVQPFTFALGPGRRGPLPGYAQDLAVPWCAGATLLPLIPIYLVGLAVYVTGVGQSVMRLKGYPPAHRDRATAMGLYAWAPLAWLLPAAACHAAAFGLRRTAEGWEDDLLIRAARLGLDGLAILLGTVSVFSSFHRSGEWFTRAHHAGAGRFAAGVAEMLARSTLGIVLFLGVVPWCVGLGWIVLDSFR
jgi:hypothetical protein